MPDKARILVVDDDVSILDFVEQSLADLGYEVVTATDGAEALDLAARQPPDLILLDMRMPIGDGWEFAEAYAQTPGPHAPIVVMTAARDAVDIAADIHAAGYLAKPFTLDDLLALVEQHARPAPSSSTPTPAWPRPGARARTGALAAEPSGRTCGGPGAAAQRVLSEG